jgi:uncharacterized membrane protein YcaP (DUF421 family)
MSVKWGAPTEEIVQVAALAAAVYVSVFVAVRLAGRRTVSQMSAFDFVVTIAIGSLVATTILSSEISYATGMSAIASLLIGQQLVALIRRSLPGVASILDFPPEVLYQQDQLKLRRNPFAAQVTEAELKSKLRQQGIESFENVQLVVLEPDGQISVWPASQGPASLPALWENTLDE